MKVTQKFGSEKLLYVANPFVNIDMFTKSTHIFWYKGDVRNYKFFGGEKAVEELLNALKRAYDAKIEAVAVTYIEADKQLEVIGFTEVGRLEPLSRKPWITRQVQRARELATAGESSLQVIAPAWKHAEMPVNQVVSDPVRKVIRVQYKEGGKACSFITEVEHQIGDFVTVEQCDGAVIRHKNVKVVSVEEMKQSQLDLLAQSLKRKNISNVLKDEPEDDPLAWNEWGGHDPRKPAPELTGVLTEEEMAEAQAFIDSLQLAK